MNPQPEAWIEHDGKTILKVNDAFLALFRCSEREIIDRRVEDIISDHDLRALARARGRAIMEKNIEEARMEYEFLRFDGSRFWGEALSTRLDDGHYKTVIRWEYDER